MRSSFPNVWLEDEDEPPWWPPIGPAGREREGSAAPGRAATTAGMVVERTRARSDSLLKFLLCIQRVSADEAARVHENAYYPRSPPFLHQQLYDCSPTRKNYQKQTLVAKIYNLILDSACPRIHHGYLNTLPASDSDSSTASPTKSTTHFVPRTALGTPAQTRQTRTAPQFDSTAVPIRRTTYGIETEYKFGFSSTSGLEERHLQIVVMTLLVQMGAHPSP